MSPRLHTMLTQCSLRAGGVSYLCQTYATWRGGVLPSKMYCLPPTASVLHASEALADTTGLVPRYLWLWGTQHLSFDPYIPALHFPEHLGSALSKTLCQLHHQVLLWFILYHAINSILSHRRAMTYVPAA